MSGEIAARYTVGEVALLRVLFRTEAGVPLPASGVRFEVYEPGGDDPVLYGNNSVEQEAPGQFAVNHPVTLAGVHTVIAICTDPRPVRQMNYFVAEPENIQV